VLVNHLFILLIRLRQARNHRRERKVQPVQPTTRVKMHLQRHGVWLKLLLLLLMVTLFMVTMMGARTIELNLHHLRLSQARSAQ
jgi:hypothetical protein